MLKEVDAFSKEVPAFNIRGDSAVNTMIGGTCSILVFAITIMYACLKTIHLVYKANPLINEVPNPGYFSNKDALNLNDLDFRFAFTVENYMTGQVRDDSRYVKWIIRFFGKEDTVPYERVVDYHKCTAEDYAQFYPVSTKSEKQLASIRDREDRGFYCLDWDDDSKIWGETSAGDHQRIEMLFVPCNYVH